MIRVAVLLLLAVFSARADRLVVRYDDAEKRGYFCHQHDGQLECRTTHPRMEFPRLKNPDVLVDSGGTFCAVENGEVDCASPYILSSRHMPEKLSRLRSLLSVSGRLCGVEAGELVCLDDKTFAETSLGKGDSLSAAREYLVATSAQSIRFWDSNLERRGDVPVPPHEHLVVLDALHQEDLATAFYCYVPQGKTLVCKIGSRSVARELQRVPRRLFANSARFCAEEEDEKGLRLECFNRYAIQSRLQFVPYQMGREEGLRAVSERGTCGIDAQDRLVCWRAGMSLEPKGFSLKGAHFTPQLTDSVTCVDSAGGAGCVREYFPDFAPAPAGSWAYAGLGQCDVDAGGGRTCQGNFFTFDPPAGKVLNVGGNGGLAIVTEEGLHIGRGDGVFPPDEKRFWPHAWKSPKPLVLDAYHIYDEGTVWKFGYDPGIVTSWQAPSFLGIADEVARMTIFAQDSVCYLKGGFSCYRLSDHQMVLVEGHPASQLTVGYGAPNSYYCYVSTRAIKCRDAVGTESYEEDFPFDEFYPAVATDGYYYYLRKRSGEIRRHDFWKGLYEKLDL